MSSTTLSGQPARARSAARITSDSRSLLEYAGKWDTPVSFGAPAFRDSRKLTRRSVPSLAAFPLQTGADAVFDHAKYFAVSHESFAMPETGSLQFSVDTAHSVIEAHQAMLTFDVTNLETNQLFDWFVSGNRAFALIERLPSNITNPTLPASDPTYVGLDRAYTQIITSAPLEPDVSHTVAIRYTRDAIQSSVDYLLDGQRIACVNHVGIPLDVQHAEYTGTYPTYKGTVGEELKDRMDTFVMGHGLYSVLDASAAEHPDTSSGRASIPATARLFGHGSQSTFSKFEVTTIGE